MEFTRVREVTDTTVVLENGSVQRENYCACWHVGSTVARTDAGLSSLDEIVEKARIQGQFLPEDGNYPNYFVFRTDPENRKYVIEKSKVRILEGNVGDCRFLERKNGFLWSFVSPQAVIPESRLAYSPGMCVVCGTQVLAEPPLSTCQHTVHFQCLATTVKKQKLLRCPLFTCSAALERSLCELLLQS